MKLNLPKNLFKSEDSKFILSTGVKVFLIALGIILFLAFIFYKILEVNNIYFISLGFLNTEHLTTAFYQYIIANSLGWVWWLFIFWIGLFFLGMYLAKSLLIPFDSIGSYCEESLGDKNVTYMANHYSSYQLLANFSEYFFTYLNVCKREGKLAKNMVPPQYTKIHKPRFDKIFFLHFSLIMGMICIITSSFAYVFGVEVYDSLVDLSITVFKLKDQGYISYIVNQAQIFESISMLAVILTIIFYIILGFHLYGKVSGAAFGFFSTMRSFMKGNYKARVHLIGYNYIRPQARLFNKYLDWIEKNLTDNNT